MLWVERVGMRPVLWVPVMGVGQCSCGFHSYSLTPVENRAGEEQHVILPDSEV